MSNNKASILIIGLVILALFVSGVYFFFIAPPVTTGDGPDGIIEVGSVVEFNAINRFGEQCSPDLDVGGAFGTVTQIIEAPLQFAIIELDQPINGETQVAFALGFFNQSFDKCLTEVSDS